MPHHPDDRRYPHLDLIVRHVTHRRRPRPPFRGSPPGRDRKSFSTAIDQKIDEIAAAERRKPRPRGVEPHLVFRLPLARGASIDSLAAVLEEVGATVVSVDPGRGAIVAFQDEGELHRFHDAIRHYRRGPREGVKSTKWDVLEFVEAEEIRAWERADRVGDALAELIGAEGNEIERNRQFKVDLELWHRGSRDLAQASLDELRKILRDVDGGGKVIDHFAGDTLCLARVEVTGRGLQVLLNASIVAEVELPPVPVFDVASAYRATPRDFPPPPAPSEDGPRLCILDSGIAAGHPLLAVNVGHEEAILTSTTSPADANGHGTRVAGLAVFGDVRACYAAGRFSSPITIFSARVTNEDNRFDDDELIITQMRRAIEAFRQSPYDCRVFNLSLGSRLAFDDGIRRQTHWAEALDLVARELEVLLVVSAGNVSLLTINPADAEAVIGGYPASLFEQEAGLLDPATAAIPITVGALVEHDVPAARRATDRDDIVQPIARTHMPSPFTRTGPGVNGAIKPEFVDEGGNLVFSGVGSQRRIAKDNGTSVMSLHWQHLDTLFGYDVGTSYAAPRVARLAALVHHRLREDRGREPHPNLVRAVLATAATVPEAVAERLERDESLRACGYGRIDEELALESGDRRVTLVDEGSVPLDHFRIYQIPILPEWRATRGTKRISIALAYDPPVRRRRADYLGVQMEFELIRGLSAEEVEDAFRKIAADEDIERAVKSRHKATLSPPQLGRPIGARRGTLVKGTHEFSQDRDYGDTYWLVVRAIRKWAPEEVEEQRFGLAVTLSGEYTDLYGRVAIRLNQRVRVRTRG